jgi:hypothetical protein
VDRTFCGRAFDEFRIRPYSEVPEMLSLPQFLVVAATHRDWIEIAFIKFDWMFWAVIKRYTNPLP